MNSIGRKLLLIIAMMGALHSIAGPQQRQASPAAADNQPLVLTISTHLVLVDAVIRDRLNRAVTGLKEADFRVYENGKLQKVSVFAVHETPAQPQRAAAAANLPPNTYTNLLRSEPLTGPPTVLLIDALNTPAADVRRLRQQLIDYVNKRTGGEHIAIYSLSNRLYELQDFTDNPELLKAAVAKITSLQSSFSNEHPDDSLEQALQHEFGATLSRDPEILRGLSELMQERIAVQTNTRVRTTLDALRRLARHLAGYPGRKNLVWVSAGFPLVMSAEVSDSQFVEGVMTSDYSEQMRNTSRLLADAQVAIYPVDPRGLVNGLMNPIDLDGEALRVTDTNTKIDRLHASMNLLASETGGQAFYNRNEIDKVLADSIADSAVYYTLGYYPSDTNFDGKFRTIDVKLGRKGLQVRSRKGYFASDTAAGPQDAQLSQEEFLGALVPEAPTATSIPIGVQIKSGTTDPSELHAAFNVDPRAILFTPDKDQNQHALLNFVLRAFDDHGKLIAAGAKTLQANLTPSDFEEVTRDGLGFDMSVKLSPGKYILVFGVRDARSRLTGTLSAPAVVP